MSLIKRRHFLQLAGSTLAAMGLSQFDFLQQSDRYGRVLAQDTPRKLALLVGINQYPTSVKELYGCCNDVELQYHLLVHRFGFNPSDILILADNHDIQPTRANIVQAFESHLINQAKPGDVVVFHYSGHGDRIEDVAALRTQECLRVGDCDLNGTIVPMDATPLGQRNNKVIVPDIMGRTLFLLTKAIDTDFVTLMLDCCHSGAGTRGDLEVRAARSRSTTGQELVPSLEELELQQRWLADRRVNLSEREFQRQRQAGIAKGVAIGSARRDQLAIDAKFDGFRAGGFTYLLTRYLWQLTRNQANETVYVNLRRSTSSLAQTKGNLTEQVPLFEYNPEENQQQPVYFTDLPTPAAEAVITQVDPLQFWLGGVAAHNMEGQGSGTVYTVLDADGTSVAEIEQTDRDGLYGRGKLRSGSADALSKGALLREKIVGISADRPLRVGIDASLRAEQLQVKAKLSAIGRVDGIDPGSSTPVDCMLGRFTDAQQSGCAPVGSLGLFSPDGTPFCDSFGRVGESVLEAIDRLRPRFKRLLANQILGQLLTGSASPLKVKVRIFTADLQGNEIESGAQIHLATRGAQEAGATVTSDQPQFRSGSLLRVEVENLERRQDLYLSILVISADGVMDVLYPTTWTDPEEAARVSRIPKQDADDSNLLTVPQNADGRAFRVRGTSGFPELMILVSKEPLRAALKGMQAIARGRGTSRGVIAGLEDDEPLDVVSQLLGDADGFTRGGSEDSPNTPATNLLYTPATLAVLSTVIEVTA